MSTKQRSTALYSHPFSKAYWRDAAAEMRSTKMLVIAALMIALRVATKGLAVPIAPNLDLFNVASFINALSAMIIGPVLAIPAAIVSDFLGVLIWDGLGSYFLPFVLQEIGSSLIWALLLYRAKVSTWKVMLGRFLICFIVNILLGTYLLVLYQNWFMGSSSLVLTWPRIFKNTFMFPIEALVMTLFLSVMIPITRKAGLTFWQADENKALKFTKAQLVTLAVLFVLGVGSVGGYLAYHYETTSMTTTYTNQQCIDMNKTMHEAVIQQCDDWDDKNVLTVIEFAKKPLFSNHTVYTVAVYEADEAFELTEKMWAYKKTPASKDKNLTRVATVTVVLDNQSNEVESFEKVEK